MLFYIYKYPLARRKSRSTTFYVLAVCVCVRFLRSCKALVQQGIMITSNGLCNTKVPRESIDEIFLCRKSGGWNMEDFNFWPRFFNGKQKKLTGSCLDDFDVEKAT